MYPVKFLEWDSTNFQRRIGAIKLPIAHDGRELKDTLQHAKDEGYRIIYVFADDHEELDQHLLHEFSGQRVATNVTFSKNIEPNDDGMHPAVTSFQPHEDASVLTELSRASGEHSRFKRDPRFSEAEFNKLYDTWITRSISREIADEVLVHRCVGSIDGMVTVRIKNDEGHVGLFSVSSDQQGKGIGTMLLQGVLQYLHRNGGKVLRIPTQRENELAVSFYRKRGLHMTDTVAIYHFL